MKVTEYKIPLFLDVERSYFMVFSSAEILCNWVEEIDVKDNLYQVYDAEGQEMKLEVKNSNIILLSTNVHLVDNFRKKLIRDISALIREKFLPESCFNEADDISRLELLVLLKAAIDP